MLKEALKTNHRDANLAVMQEKTRFAVRENTTQQFALNVAKKQKFHLNQEKTDLYSAANVLQLKKVNNHTAHAHNQIKAPLMGAF